MATTRSEVGFSAIHESYRTFLIAMLAGLGHAIRTLVTIFAVPFTPVPTRPADLAVPRVVVLDDLIPTERIAVILRAFRALIANEQRFQRHVGVLTWELVKLVQLRLGEGFVSLDILDDAHREIFGIHAVKRILAFLTLALVGTTLSAFQARATAIDTTGFTFTHPQSPLSVIHRIIDPTWQSQSHLENAVQSRESPPIQVG